MDKEIRNLKTRPLSVNKHSERPLRLSGRLGGRLRGFALLSLLLLAGFLWLSKSGGGSVIDSVLSQEDSLNSSGGRVNVLLLGIGGGSHDGALLTDSIIVVSYSLKTHRAMLISIPRDLWLESIRQKVNAAYELGMEKKNGGNGLKFAEDRIDDVLGMPIQYGVRIDFGGFAKAIDLVGGVDVNVPRAFDDYRYPIEGRESDLCGWQDTTRDLTADEAKVLNVPTGRTRVYIDPTGKISTDSASLDFSCRFEHIHFDKGSTHMDGAMALKFVRSRHALGPEGSDFARSKRQQLVIEAFRDKVLSLQILTNPGRIAGLIGALGQSIDTDITPDKYLAFYNLAKKLAGTDNMVLGDLTGGKSVLINPSSGDYGRAWVLTPPGNDFTRIKDYIKRQLDAQDASASAAR